MQTVDRSPTVLSSRDVGSFELRVSQTSYGYIVSANGPAAHLNRALSRRYVTREAARLRCDDGRRPSPSSVFSYDGPVSGRYSHHYRCD